MNNDQRLTSIISFTLMLATAVLGWFTLSDRLSLPKISTDRSLGVVVASEQDVTARLWEDPLQAVQMEAGKKGDESTHEPAGFIEACRRKLGTTNRVCLLVVPIPGTPFPDDVETRLRLRYSIQMALADQNCSPEDRNHLGYVRMPWPGDDGMHLVSPEVNKPSRTTNLVFGGSLNTAAREYDLQLTTVSNLSPPKASSSGPQINHSRFANVMRKRVNVPYEWFESRKTANLKIVVLWLPEELLSSEPLCRFAYLRDKLTPDDADSRTRCVGPFVVGPRSSNSLKVMALGDYATNNHACSDLLRTNLSIFSPQATAPDALISLEATNDWTQARADMVQKLSKRLSQGADTNWVYFKNFIAPDDQLADLLVRELDLRHINLHSNSADRVLLLAEADTSYGRALPLAFQAALESFREPGVFTNGQSKTPTRLAAYATTNPPTLTTLIVARYLQGLDAQKGFQSTDNSAAKGARSAEQTLAEMLNKKSAPAVGESQLDYAERLAEQLAHDETCKQVKAVGILGSDIYDKLVLLRSLRARFPEALFFTTDLDARLWHPDHFKITRNLIVASAHDLNINKSNVAYRIAPFRDVYQATVFNACVAALKEMPGRTTNQTLPLEPAIYEVGRRGAVPLADGTAQAGANTRQRLGLARISIGAVVLLVCGVIVSSIVLRLRHQREDRLTDGFKFVEFFQARTGWLGQFLFCAIVLITFFALITSNRGEHAGAEPWSWSVGISIWPTELVRLFIIFSVVWMLVWSWHRHLRHRDQLHEEFNLKVVNDRDQDSARGSKKIRDHLRQLCSCPKRIWEQIKLEWPTPERSPGPDQSETIVADKVFACYQAKAAFGARLLRAISGSLIYFLFGMGIMLLGGMPLNTHIRGAEALLWDRVILFSSIVAWLVLVFYVLDAVCIAAQLLRKINEPHTHWPASLLQKNVRALGVQREDLEGYLDVRFAAAKTQETGRLIFLPFLIQFLMLIARNSYFDNWSWPPFLVLIFVGNMLLAAAAWVILRRAAAGLRCTALEKLEDHLRQVEGDILLKRLCQPVPGIRKLGLLEIKRRIEGEQRGAYARWMQDPAFLALLVPTGLLGILSVLFQALFGFM